MRVWFGLRRVGWELAAEMGHRGVAACGRKRIAFSVGVATYGEDQRGVTTGLKRCGCVHTCPVCTSAIRAERAAEIRAAVEKWGRERVVMLTVTLRHGWGDDFGWIERRVQKAYSRMIGNRPFKRALMKLGGTIGKIQTKEATHGQNGWHPHIHVLLFLNRASTPSELKAFEDAVAELWRSAVRRYVDAEHVPTAEHGLRVTRCHDETYIQKEDILNLEPSP